jgi:hypothetical protein
MTPAELEQLKVAVGLVCRCLRCCCPPGRGHNHPRYNEMWHAMHPERDEQASGR